MEVYEVDRLLSEPYLSFHEAFFSDRLFAKGMDLATYDWVLREEGIPVAKRFSSESGVVDTMFGMRIAGLVLNVLKQVDVLVPVRRLIDLLERDDVRRMFANDSSDFL